MTEDRTAETGGADIVERNLPAIAELCRRFGVRRLDLFGSAATGRFDHHRSDLDFLVEFKPEARGKSYFRLLEEFEKLFGRKVDLLTEPGLENPYLRRRIEIERRTLFPAAMISNKPARFYGTRDARWSASLASSPPRPMPTIWTTTCCEPRSKRQLEITGEAFVGLRRVDPSLAGQLPDLPKVVAFRNLLIRGYATIDHQIVWDAIRDDLPRLAIALNQMLGTVPPP